MYKRQNKYNIVIRNSAILNAKINKMDLSPSIKVVEWLDIEDLHSNIEAILIATDDDIRGSGWFNEAISRGASIFFIYENMSNISCCIIVKNTIVHQYSLICMLGKNDQSIDFGNTITYTPLRPNIHVVDNNFYQQCVTYSQYCGKLEILNVYFSVILNHTLHGTVIELSLHRYNVLLPILQ